MQIGRRIYYDLATGNVILDTGERQGSVIDTTTQQDFVAYAELAQRVPETVGMKQLSYGELLGDFMSGNAYHVDLNSGVIVFDTTPPLPVLDVVKQRKIAELKVIESAKLETFKSSALGTEHTYLSGLTDMLLLTGQYSYVKGSDFDGLDFMWYTVENGNVTHTAAQFIQMYLDARTNVSTVKYHRAALEYQVNASTTIDDVNAIVW